VSTKTTSEEKAGATGARAAEPAQKALDQKAPDRGPRLDPDVTELMRLATDLNRATSRALRDQWRKRKLSERGLFILELVHAGLDRPSRLIEYFDVLPSTITFETDKLVAAGLIVRESAPNDRRVVLLRLTEEGRVVHRETTETINATLRPQIAAVRPEDFACLLETFRAVVDPLRPKRTSDDAATSDD
jgi:DNA-binding MarR family transcriptional regulator